MYGEYAYALCKDYVLEYCVGFYAQVLNVELSIVSVILNLHVLGNYI